MISTYFLDFLFIVFFSTALVWSPYTKIEESFNLHAIHNSILIGLDNITDFDHNTFPGVVKRSCLGAIAVALPQIYLTTSMDRIGNILCTFRMYLLSLTKSSPSAAGMDVCHSTNLDMLLTTRFILGLYVTLGLIYFKNSIIQVTYRKSPNGRLAIIWQLMTYSLPHLIFYVSRTLPNVMTLPTTLIGMGLFIRGDIPKSLMILSSTGVVFRFEILIFTIILSGVTYLNKLSNMKSIGINLAIGVCMGCYLSYQIDSYFWSESTIPEIESFIFNVIHGQSENWGVEPVWAYWVKYLPRIFITNGFITPVCALAFSIGSFRSTNWKRKLDRVNYEIGTITVLVWSTLLFIGVLSINGHKEWRFLMFTIPVLTLGGASSLDYLYSKNYKFIVSVLVLCGFLLGVVSSIVFTYISSWNYSGGEIVQKLNMRVLDEGPQLGGVNIHWDVGTCGNGGSLFCQLTDDLQDKLSVKYDKYEGADIDGSQFKYWVQYRDDALPELSVGCQWTLIEMQDGITGVNFDILKTVEMAKRSVISHNWRFPLSILESLPAKAPVSKVYEKTCLNF